MNSDTIYGGAGIALFSIGFGVMATTDNSSVFGISAVLVFLGIAMMTYAYILAKRNEKEENRKRLFIFKFGMDKLSEIHSAINDVNSNIEKLLDEIRMERNERNNKQTGNL